MEFFESLVQILHRECILYENEIYMVSQAPLLLLLHIIQTQMDFGFELSLLLPFLPI